MTFEALKQKIEQQLKNAGFESARFEANQMVDAAQKNGDLSNAEEMLKRRLSHEPLQYILGEWEFYGLPIVVGQGVLIPRQDTETVVEQALKLLKGIHNPKVYDLCAGTGCIGIALAVLGNAEVTLFEKSDVAINYINKNIALNKVSARVVKCDVLLSPKEAELVDMIISNPPYIRSDVLKELSDEVKQEPQMALDGGEDGLVFYKALASKWKHLIKPNGYLVFEIGYDQREQVMDIMKAEGFAEVSCIKDLCGNDRVVIGKKQG